VGEQQNQPFQLSFNPSLKVDFQGSRVTSDGGLLVVRELDERLGLSELIADHLTDFRGKNTHPYIQSPEGERLWLADLDARQRALAERLVEAANFGNSVLGTSAAKARVARKISMPLTN
jgi:hypothetical protein